MKKIDKKIKTRYQLSKIILGLKKKKKKIVFTNGCFDILHKGHVKLLEKSKKLGNTLIVAINTDVSVKKLKGPKRPINKQKDRALLLAALEPVDYVTFFNEETPEKIIKSLNPDILVKGGDWKKSHIAGKSHVESYRGKVLSIPFVKGYSTSALLKKIHEK